jgi:hypothetical protein
VYTVTTLYFGKQWARKRAYHFQVTSGIVDVVAYFETLRRERPGMCVRYLDIVDHGAPANQYLVGKNVLTAPDIGKICRFMCVGAAELTLNGCKVAKMPRDKKPHKTLPYVYLHQLANACPRLQVMACRGNVKFGPGRRCENLWFKVW